MNHGQFTRELGDDIENRLGLISGHDVKVFYDHGRKGMPKIVPYFGRYSTASTLSNVDCAIVRGERVLALCEVEEETATPKKIIGDICNLLLADCVRIGGDDFCHDKSHLFLGVRTREGGKGEEKARRLKKLILDSVRKSAIREIKIHVICHTQNDVLIRLLAAKMLRAANARVR
jgi:hypothetical protein